MARGLRRSGGEGVMSARRRIHRELALITKKAAPIVFASGMPMAT